MTRKSDTEFDLTISRMICPPRSLVWSAWVDPVSFAQWWIPHQRDARSWLWSYGRAARSVPHLNACFLDVVEGERIVFSDALTGGWRPAEQPFFTAVITLADWGCPLSVTQKVKTLFAVG